MRGILVAAAVSLALSLVGTPAVIRFFRRHGYGQLIREDGPKDHQVKRGTPTMGGAAIILSAVGGYVIATAVVGKLWPPSPGGLLTMATFAGMGAVGFVDDAIKLRRNRNLGLSKTAKFVGQATVAVTFAFGAQYVAQTSTQLSAIGPLALDFGPILFPLFIFFLLSGFSNAVNLTDGLDGLAAGTSAFVFGAYTVIAFWIFRHGMATYDAVGQLTGYTGDYSLAAWVHADTLAIAAASAMGASLGFLWWNAPPAKIFMGDTGSLAIGGMLAALAVLTETELLLVLLGGLFVVETMSVILQVLSFRVFKRRIFNMAPLHHHFELAGWKETTVIVRFWIVGGLCTAFGLGLFYAEYLARVGPG